MRVAFLLLALLWGPLAAQAATVRAVKSPCGGRWSQGSTWDTGRPPQANDFVQIDAGCVVVYDLASSPPLAEVNIEGSLVFALDRATELTVSLLLVEPTGRLEIGTAAQPLPPQHTATIRLIDLPDQTHTHLHGQPQIAPALHTHGGTLRLAGAPKTPTWTRLAADALAGATTLVLADVPQGWRVGDRVVITGTVAQRVTGQGLPLVSAYMTQTGCDIRMSLLACQDPVAVQVETHTLAALDGARLTLATPLQSTHLGTAPGPAAVGNLTRNIVITSADPAGRRGHVMVAHGFVVGDEEPLPPLTNLATAVLQFVEFAHLGRPEPGLYPVHFHRLGYEGRRSLLRGASIHHSQNLCVRVHGTTFLSVAETVCYDALGHGFATEDGTEMFNVFERNLAVRTRFAPAKTNPNDPTDVNEGSGFWLNNPQNYLRGNMATDTDGWGFQIDPRTTGGQTPVGVRVSTSVLAGGPPTLVDVTELPLLEFADNTAHSGWLGGIEVTNLRSPVVLRASTSLHTRLTGLATFLHRLTLDHWQSDVGPQRYANGVFPGIAVPLGPSVTVLASVITGTFLTGYQAQLPTLLAGGSFADVRHNNVVDQNLLVVIGPGTQVDRLLLDAQNHPYDTTSQLEVYLWQYDGPGAHRKLMQSGARAADALVYHPTAVFPSPYSACAVLTPGVPSRVCWQEARFADPGTQGPPLRLPVRITVGNAAWSQHGTIQGRDVFDAQGQRWMADHTYTNLPPDLGYRLARYGHLGGILVRSDVGSIYGTTLVRATVAPMSYRVDVPNGTYHLDLHFLERWQGLPTYILNRKQGARVFDVLVQGQRLLQGLDVFVEAGGVEQPLVKSFDGIVVSEGHLLLEWPTPGGMLSALALCTPAQVVNGQCGGD
jgi:hypothetical protein